MNVKYCVAIFIGFTLVAVGNGFRFILCARNLPSMDPENGAPDTYINVKYASSATAPYQLLGRTKYVLNDKNPDFPEIFTIPEGGDSTEALKFDIYDADSPDEGDDYMGYVWTRISTVKKDTDLVVQNSIKSGVGAGQLFIKVQAS